MRGKEQLFVVQLSVMGFIVPDVAMPGIGTMCNDIFKSCPYLVANEMNDLFVVLRVVERRIVTV